MLFKRRKKFGLGERLRLLLWPRRSWSRSIRYVFLRLKRVPSSPHRIALGAAIGVFAVFTPFVGLQLLLAGLLSFLLRASIVASFLSSFFGNPFTYPMIWFATYNLGNVLLGSAAPGRLVDLRGRAAALWDGLTSGSLQTMLEALENFWPIFKPMIIGSLPLGVFAGCITYIGVRRLIGAPYKKKPVALSEVS